MTVMLIVGLVGRQEDWERGLKRLHDLVGALKHVAGGSDSGKRDPGKF